MRENSTHDIHREVWAEETHNERKLYTHERHVVMDGQGTLPNDADEKHYIFRCSCLNTFKCFFWFVFLLLLF